MIGLPVYRVTVWVPPADLARLQLGICAIEGLQLGEYDQVMWVSAPGREQFRPLHGAVPAVGIIGEATEGASVRLEFAIPRDPERLQRVIDQGIRPNHPWEVPAIFVDESWFPLPDPRRA